MLLANDLDAAREAAHQITRTMMLQISPKQQKS